MKLYIFVFCDVFVPSNPPLWSRFYPALSVCNVSGLFGLRLTFERPTSLCTAAERAVGVSVRRRRESRISQRFGLIFKRQSAGGALTTLRPLSINRTFRHSLQAFAGSVKALIQMCCSLSTVMEYFKQHENTQGLHLFTWLKSLK